jgi:CheY-like chemotaxis protein
MLKLEYLFSVSALKLKEKFNHTDDKQISMYECDLNAFLCDYPKHKSAINDALNTQNFQVLSRELAEISIMLNKICAYDISAECRIYNNLEDMPYEEIEKNVNSVLETVAMLIIDIQIAMYKKSIASCKKTTNDNEIKTILAVDDMPLFLKNLKAMLQNMPHKIVCVTSAKDALRFIEKHQPDLFVLDIEMPDINGYQLAEKIIDAGQKAPIIFMTGNSSSEDVEKALSKGVSDFIIKTMNKEYIIEKIKKYI